MTERELRHRIVDRLVEKYPGQRVKADYQTFLDGGKVSIDSWIGDAFAVIVHRDDYEKWRAALFTD